MWLLLQNTRTQQVQGRCDRICPCGCVCVQVHHVTRQVEYRGDVVALTEALVGFPSGGQVLMSGSTYQRVYGNLHTVQLDDHLLTKLNKLSSKKAAAGNTE